jgi:hypothetical protein
MSETKERWCLIKLLGKDAYIGRVIFHAPYSEPGQPLFVSEADYDALAAELERVKTEASADAHYGREELRERIGALAAELGEIKRNRQSWADVAQTSYNRIRALEATLREVCNELDYYGDQAGECFREKGGCDETLTKARALLTGVETSVDVGRPDGDMTCEATSDRLENGDILFRDMVYTPAGTLGLPSGWTMCGQCGTQWLASDGALLPCPTCSEASDAGEHS